MGDWEAEPDWDSLVTYRIEWEIVNSGHYTWVGKVCKRGY